MPDIKPNSSLLLNDEDVEYAHFKCCGDEDLVFLRCPSCRHIWVDCYECDTWYVDLHDLSNVQHPEPSPAGGHVRCPSCGTAFEDAQYLSKDVVDKYLPTAEQVADAGHGRHLARHLRIRFGPET
ncbi:hypothetical protein AB4Z46_07940 [Variovorax sp. M-6]|uniref:hypothetical protein n=1 Tax=Variovorax sp. M-6 TaxID=3233041 RepID=UPI003F9B51C9